MATRKRKATNKKPPGTGVGAPRKVIDYALVKRLASIQCTYEEISDIMDIAIPVLTADERFVKVYKTNCSTGRTSLRRLQFRSAQNGNVAALIWLGKQYLKQRDKPEDEDDDAPVAPVKVEITFRDARKVEEPPPAGQPVITAEVKG